MSENIEYESEWVQLIRERYEPDPDVEMSYEDENNLLWLLNAPEQYQVEEEMLQYAKQHPQETMKELLLYFDSIVPEGLPPCADEWEDDDE